MGSCLPLPGPGAALAQHIQATCPRLATSWVPLCQPWPRPLEVGQVGTV